MSSIQFEEVWKKFTLHHQRTKSIKQAVVDSISPFRKKYQIDAFWALQGVSLTVEKGETLGIIGSNGSGKSTLLKLAVGISKPNRGKVQVNGRISALLELGAGFHPDFTGRENIFLNGAILGLSKKEIARRFDDIVEFAEISPFIDNPVRTYSSGMYMRLAFAIAINVNPDILVIDEVLAVGDSAFQEKCFEQILRFKREGKSILFVSHDLSSVQSFCDRVIWLERGRQMANGTPEEIIPLYKQHLANKSKGDDEAENSTLPIRFHSGRFLADTEPLPSGESACIEFAYENSESNYQPAFRFRINREDGVCCYQGKAFEPAPRGISSRVRIELDRLSLLSGRYYCEIIACDASGGYPQEVCLSLPFEVQSGVQGEGIIPIRHIWSFSPANTSSTIVH